MISFLKDHFRIRKSNWIILWSVLVSPLHSSFGIVSEQNRWEISWEIYKKQSTYWIGTDRVNWAAGIVELEIFSGNETNYIRFFHLGYSNRYQNLPASTSNILYVEKTPLQSYNKWYFEKETNLNHLITNYWPNRTWKIHAFRFAAVIDRGPTNAGIEARFRVHFDNLHLSRNNGESLLNNYDFENGNPPENWVFCHLKDSTSGILTDNVWGIDEDEKEGICGTLYVKAISNTGFLSSSIEQYFDIIRISKIGYLSKKDSGCLVVPVASFSIREHKTNILKSLIIHNNGNAVRDVDIASVNLHYDDFPLTKFDGEKIIKELIWNDEKKGWGGNELVFLDKSNFLITATLNKHHGDLKSILMSFQKGSLVVSNLRDAIFYEEPPTEVLLSEKRVLTDEEVLRHDRNIKTSLLHTLIDGHEVVFISLSENTQIDIYTLTGNLISRLLVGALVNNSGNSDFGGVWRVPEFLESGTYVAVINENEKESKKILFHVRR